jgi:hypothetical protein
MHSNVLSKSFHITGFDWLNEKWAGSVHVWETREWHINLRSKFLEGRDHMRDLNIQQDGPGENACALYSGVLSSNPGKDTD